ncbi:MAG: GNAT family N-acetyltransferase, partial [Candidatus Thorarchaeota archaeon]
QAVSDFLAHSSDLLDRYEDYDASLSCSSMELCPGKSLYVVVSFRPIRGHYTCPKCGLEVEDMPSNMEWGSGLIMCPDLKHGAVFFEESVLKTDGFEDGVHRLPQTRDGYKIYRELLYQAKVEEKHFLTVPWERFKSGDDRVYIAVDSGRIVGYSQWNDDFGKRIFRQVFVMSDSRQKGFGSALARIEGGLPGQFLVESPNDSGLNLLIRLGYAKKEKEDVIGVKCGFIQGM